jgi:hypothetical protein
MSDWDCGEAMSKEFMEFTQLQESAAECLAQNKYGEAIALHEQCIETDSTVISNYWYLGLALLLDGAKVFVGWAMLAKHL